MQSSCSILSQWQPFKRQTPESSQRHCVQSGQACLRPANLTDMNLLFERSGIWSEAVTDYVLHLIDKYVSCRSTAPPQPNTKVSILSVSRRLNDIVCVVHSYLHSVCLFHCIDITTSFSAALYCQLYLSRPGGDGLRSLSDLSVLATCLCTRR